MKWAVTDIVAPSTNLGDYVLQIGGPLGLVIIGLAFVVVVLYRENKQLRQDLSAEKDKRLLDAQEYAKLTLQPFQQFTEFVRNLYDGYNTRSKDG